jgi:hypothetical protein
MIYHEDQIIPATTGGTLQFHFSYCWNVEDRLENAVLLVWLLGSGSHD